MNIPEEFGKYLLLKKLAEDPLGETFRAGRVGQEGMDQVVLLRVFNGKGLDGEALWRPGFGTRPACRRSLKSPNIGNGVDLGRVRSFPYAAYDYISGKNLAAVFAQSAPRALADAHRPRAAHRRAHLPGPRRGLREPFKDERVTHGFVVPQLVMVSNEGETRLLGFEAAPGLSGLAAAGWQDESLRPYLAPERWPGPRPRAPTTSTPWAPSFTSCSPASGYLPAPQHPPEGYGALIDGAELPNEGTPLPAPVAALLKKSLVPREQRIADAVTWHKTLSKLMIDGHFSPTTFNLAFFMHNLFRDDIERESQEMQAEKKLELPPRRQPAPVPVPVAAPAPLREGTGVREGTLSGTLSGTRSQAARQPEPSRKGLWIGIAAVLALAVLGGAGYYFFGRTSAPGPQGPVPGAAPTPQPVALPGVTPAPAVPAAAGPSEEQIQAQIQQMFEARSKEMEAKFKNQYDDRIKQLQQQLEDTRKTNQQASAPPSAAPVETRLTPRLEPPAPAAAQEKPAVPTPQPAPSQPSTAEKTERPATTPAPVPANPAPAVQTPAPAPRPAQVQAGDLVQPGPGVAPPKLQSQLDPRYPPAAQRLNRAAQVDIKVLVDERGRVMDAERIGTKAGFGFDEAALDAARRAIFQPATKDGVRVKMWMTLRVNFTPPIR